MSTCLLFLFRGFLYFRLSLSFFFFFYLSQMAYSYNMKHFPVHHLFFRSFFFNLYLISFYIYIISLAIPLLL